MRRRSVTAVRLNGTQVADFNADFKVQLQRFGGKPSGEKRDNGNNDAGGGVGEGELVALVNESCGSPQNLLSWQPLETFSQPITTAPLDGLTEEQSVACRIALDGSPFTRAPPVPPAGDKDPGFERHGRSVRGTLTGAVPAAPPRYLLESDPDPYIYSTKQNQSRIALPRQIKRFARRSCHNGSQTERPDRHWSATNHGSKQYGTPISRTPRCSLHVAGDAQILHESQRPVTHTPIPESSIADIQEHLNRAQVYMDRKWRSSYHSSNAQDGNAAHPAIGVLEQATAAVRSWPNSAATSDHLHDIASMYFTLGELNTSLQLEEEALDIAECSACTSKPAEFPNCGGTTLQTEQLGPPTNRDAVNDIAKTPAEWHKQELTRHQGAAKKASPVILPRLHRQVPLSLLFPDRNCQVVVDETPTPSNCQWIDPMEKRKKSPSIKLEPRNTTSFVGNVPCQTPRAHAMRKLQREHASHLRSLQSDPRQPHTDTCPPQHDQCARSSISRIPHFMYHF